MLLDRVWPAVCNRIFRVPETIFRVYFHAFDVIRDRQIRDGRGTTIYQCFSRSPSGFEK